MGIPSIAASPISRAPSSLTRGLTSHPPLTAEGKAPDRPRNPGLPRPCVGDPGGQFLGRTQPDKWPLGAPVPGEAAPKTPCDLSQYYIMTLKVLAGEFSR